jgi:hypothetical protein
MYRSSTYPNPIGQLTGVRITCPSGQYPTGGGVETDSFVQWVNESRPDRSAAGAPIDSWVGWVYNDGTFDHTFAVHVVCAAASSVVGNFGADNRRSHAPNEQLLPSPNTSSE